MVDANSIRQVLEDELGYDLDGIDNDTLLFSTGTVDSFALVTLILQLEQQSGLRIGPGDVTLENFDSIDRMLAYLARAKAE